MPVPVFITGDFTDPVEIFSHDAQDPEGMQFYSPNTWWFYYFGTKMEHDVDVASVHSEGGIGRFLLVVE